MDMEMNRIPTVAMIDSGAARDYLSASYAADWGLTLFKKKSPYLLTTADGSPIAHNQGIVTHKARVSLGILNQVETVTLDVTNTGNSDIILGLPWLQRTNPRID